MHSSCSVTEWRSWGDGKEAAGSGEERVRKENRLGSVTDEDAWETAVV